MTLEDRLYDIERQLWTGGPDVYRAHVDDTCLTVFTEMTALLDRERIVQSVDGHRWNDVAMSRKGFTQPAQSVAIITYKASARRSDGRIYHALVSSGYARRLKEWRMMFHQQTPLESH